MATPPANRCGGGESTAADTPRSVPTPFLTKTYQLVDDRSTNDVISWNEDGSAFIVWKSTEFARDLLPKYFKHSNFSSFVRQLNTYGFKKIMPDRWEFLHECFRRGEKKLLCDIQRRKMAMPSSPAVPPTPVLSSKTVFPSDSGDEQVISSSNSPESVREFGGSKEELLGENDKLRKENVQLNKELSQMKSMCRNIYVLMSNYAGSCGEKRNGRSDSVVKSLDLLPIRSGKEMETAIVEAAVTRGDEECSLRSAAEEISARLFWVPIRTTRGRDGESGTAEQEMDLLQLQQPGGSEMVAQPLEQDVNGDDQQSSWLPRSKSLNRMV